MKETKSFNAKYVKKHLIRNKNLGDIKLVLIQMPLAKGQKERKKESAINPLRKLMLWQIKKKMKSYLNQLMKIIQIIKFFKKSLILKWHKKLRIIWRIVQKNNKLFLMMKKITKIIEISSATLIVLSWIANLRKLKNL